MGTTNQRLHDLSESMPIDEFPEPTKICPMASLPSLPALPSSSRSCPSRARRPPRRRSPRLSRSPRTTSGASGKRWAVETASGPSERDLADLSALGIDTSHVQVAVTKRHPQPRKRRIWDWADDDELCWAEAEDD